MRAAVERHDSGVVHHFVEDDDGVGGLQQLHVHVVGVGRHGWAGIEAQDAALADGPILGSNRRSLTHRVLR
ncbi:MAG: hypothetical protein DMF90_02815 [Acidobacteria bacterium]|nr:MAG: hypothetical protein DMF90_02815 [Acidobacteriota bacterium]